MIAVTLLALLLAAASYAALFSVGRHAPIPGTPYTLEIAPGVAQDDVELVSRGLRLADTYFRAAFGLTTTPPITVRLTKLVSCAFGDRSTGVATANRLCLYVGGRTWLFLKRQDSVNVLSSVAHEHVHNLQAQLGCLPDAAGRQYAWITEGSANYYSWAAVIHAGLITPQAALERQRAFAHSGETLRPLWQYEKVMGGNAAYFLSRNAVAQLDRQSGPRAFIAFCTQAGANWQAAFQQAYGLSVPDFYAAFRGMP